MECDQNFVVITRRQFRTSVSGAALATIIRSPGGAGAVSSRGLLPLRGLEWAGFGGVNRQLATNQRIRNTHLQWQFKGERSAVSMRVDLAKLSNLT